MYCLANYFLSRLDSPHLEVRGVGINPAQTWPRRCRFSRFLNTAIGSFTKVGIDVLWLLLKHPTHHFPRYRSNEERTEVKRWQCYIKSLTTPCVFILEKCYRKEATTEPIGTQERSHDERSGLQDKLHCREVLLHISFLPQAGMHQIVHQPEKYSWKFDKKNHVFKHCLRIKGSLYGTPWVLSCTIGSSELKRYIHRRGCKTWSYYPEYSHLKEAKGTFSQVIFWGRLPVSSVVPCLFF